RVPGGHLASLLADCRRGQECPRGRAAARDVLGGRLRRQEPGAGPAEGRGRSAGRRRPAGGGTVMIRDTPCPDATRLSALLHHELPGEEQAELIGHLDSCDCCQKALEELATGGDRTLIPAGGGAHDPPSDSAYWPALRRVEGDVH